jgi:long-subunit fatty acid transport protein
MSPRHFGPRSARPDRFLVLVTTVFVVLIGAGSSPAQEAPPALEFNFSNPGARSMGLGGAFVALADDATAASANPAGLVQLVDPEVSVEYRRRRYTSPYTEGGRASGEPTGNGIDTLAGLRTGFSTETTSGISYLSFVYPGTGWSLAVYQHQLADFAFNTELNGLFGHAPEGGTRRDLDQLTSTDFKVRSTGVSGAVDLGDSFSLGIGFVYFAGDIQVLGAGYLVDQYPETFWEANSFFPDRVFETSAFESTGSDIGISAGFLWRFSEGWRLGGVYRQGPSLEYSLVNRAGPAHWLPEGTVTGQVSAQSLVLPDVWGLGVAYRSPSGHVTVGFEWDRVEYSVIMESLESSLVDTTFVNVDDANELHLGIEYVFLDLSPVIAVRGGLWHDPNHSFEYIGDDPIEQALYPPGSDALHINVGAGVAFRKVQFDIGADFSDAIDQFAVSAIFSF